jgi:NADPH-dependent glutamate synthase beta subunit-like oxidoreductase
MVTSPLEIAKGAEEIGLDAVTIFNRATGLEIDVEEEKPVMHGGYAGHGGPWAIQYALRWISEAYPEVKVPIAGSGGVWSSEDLIKFFLCGAQVVQFCSAIYFHGYRIIRDLHRGLEHWMDEKGYLSIDEFRGKICGRIIGSDHVYREHHLVAGIERKGLPPCEVSCPAGLPIQGYLQLCAEGREAKALDLIREVTPLAGVLGRVCDHPCEASCVRSDVDEPLAVCAVKRWLADEELERLGEPEALPLVGVEAGSRGKVAVIGSGPAGLTAAWRLVRRGFEVTVYERHKTPGGMLTWAIPRYRLPAKILDAELGLLKKAGVSFKCGEAVSVEDVIGEGAGAVVLAVGACSDAKLGLEGEDKLCTGALSFLREASSNRRPKLKGRVAVIGGGNVAVDAARTALRCGAKEVTVLYRRDRDQMPAIPEEVSEAEAEGVTFEFLAGPVRLVGSKKISAVECVRMKLGEPDASGRPRPVPKSKSEFTVKCDVLIPAIGQVVDASALSDSEVTFTADGLVSAEEPSLATSRQGVFACGDAVAGPSTVAGAVGQGVRAAASVELFLEGRQLPTAEEEESRELRKIEKREILSGDELPTRRIPTLPDKRSRKLGFSEIRQGYDRRRARAEAARCLGCAGCSACGECGERCIFFAVERVGRAVLVDREKCDGCGMCAELCSQNAISMLETGGS